MIITNTAKKSCLSICVKSIINLLSLDCVRVSAQILLQFPAFPGAFENHLLHLDLLLLKLNNLLLKPLVLDLLRISDSAKTLNQQLKRVGDLLTHLINLGVPDLPNLILDALNVLRDQTDALDPLLNLLDQMIEPPDMVLGVLDIV